MDLHREIFNGTADGYRKRLAQDDSSNSRKRMKGKSRSLPGSFDIGNFKQSILRKKKVLLSNMKLSKHTLQDLDDYMFYLLEKIDKELRLLQKKGKGKKLALKDLETIVRLCLPKHLGTRVSTYARNATDTYFSENKEK